MVSWFHLLNEGRVKRIVRKHFDESRKWFRNHRFHLLLPVTIMVLFIPAFFSNGLVTDILFFCAMSFLFIQSMYAAAGHKRHHTFFRYTVVVMMIVVIWLEPAGVHSKAVNLVRIMMLIGFFLFITFSLSRFLLHAARVNIQVILVTINIYLMIGLISANISLLLFQIYPGAYHFPDKETAPAFVDFVYLSFITLSTVGYGDITPAIRQSQFFAYLTAITGQLYMTVILGIIIGKYLAHSAKSLDEQFKQF